MNKKIKKARVVPSKGFGTQAKVMVVLDEEEELLFRFFDDELSFSPEEFIGLSVEDAKDLLHKKDVAYLQS